MAFQFCVYLKKYSIDDTSCCSFSYLFNRTQINNVILKKRISWRCIYEENIKLVSNIYLILHISTLPNYENVFEVEFSSINQHNFIFRAICFKVFFIFFQIHLMATINFQSTAKCFPNGYFVYEKIYTYLLIFFKTTLIL